MNNAITNKILEMTFSGPDLSFSVFSDCDAPLVWESFGLGLVDLFKVSLLRSAVRNRRLKSVKSSVVQSEKNEIALLKF